MDKKSTTPQFKDKKVELGVHGATHLYMDATWCHLRFDDF